ncbi:MAG TPA: hypothetical protein VHJ58_17995, partial [Vicinamibacterales bacterium]|nr:hypothetical protein [Vicinamibacterales bacterium]
GLADLHNTSPAPFAASPNRLRRNRVQSPIISENVPRIGSPCGATQTYPVAQIFPRWNPLTSWMRQIEGFQRAA